MRSIKTVAKRVKAKAHVTACKIHKHASYTRIIFEIIGSAFVAMETVYALFSAVLVLWITLDVIDLTESRHVERGHHV